MIYLHESAPAHALDASLTHHHVMSCFQGKVLFSSSLTDLQYTGSLALLNIQTRPGSYNSPIYLI